MMPDITLCVRKECPSKFDCYRYMAQGKKIGQSHSYFENSCNAENNYNEFIEIGRYDKLDGKRAAEKLHELSRKS